MKEPDDEDADGGKSDGSKSGGKQSRRASQAASTTKEDDKVLEDATDETFAEGEELYLEDDDSCGEHLEGSSSSLQDDFVESTGESQYMETPGPAAEESEEEIKKISPSFFYNYMELVLMPFVTPDSSIPLDLLKLVYPLQLHMCNFGISAS